MDIAVVMDAIAEACIANVIKRVYSWPTESITVPCMVVAYPETIDFDFTMADGSDSAIFPLYYIAGKVSDRTTRDELSQIISGASAVADAINGDLDGAVNSANVGDCDIELLTIAGIQYASVKFNVEIIY